MIRTWNKYITLVISSAQGINWLANNTKHHSRHSRGGGNPYKIKFRVDSFRLDSRLRGNDGLTYELCRHIQCWKCVP